MKVADLLANIKFEVDDRALKDLTKSMNETRDSINSLGDDLNTVKNIMEFVVGAETIKKLYDLSESFAKWGQELRITSGLLGVTTDEVQKLSFAAGQSGVSTEEMTHGMSHLARTIYQLKQGSEEAAKEFYKAGISINQAKSFNNAEDALLALSTVVRNTQSPMERLGKTTALLGRGSIQMTDFLAKGPEAIKAMGKSAQDLGLIISRPQINNLEAMAQGFQRLHLFMDELGAYVASYFGPAIIQVIDAFIKFYNINRKVIDQELKQWLNGVAYTMGFVAGLVLRAAQWFLYFTRTVHDLYAELNKTPAWGNGLPSWAQAIADFFESFGVGGKHGIRLSDLFKGENADTLTALLGGILDKVKSKIKELLAAMIATLKGELINSGIAVLLADVLKEMVTKIGDVLEGLITGVVKLALQSVVSGLTLILGSTIGGLLDVLSKVAGGKITEMLHSGVGDTTSGVIGTVLKGLGLAPTAGSESSPGFTGPPRPGGGTASTNTYAPQYHFDVKVNAGHGADGKEVGQHIFAEIQRHMRDFDLENRKKFFQDQQAQSSVSSVGVA